nr:unnamed protein product [Callosobruchus analis]
MQAMSEEQATHYLQQLRSQTSIQGVEPNESNKDMSEVEMEDSQAPYQFSSPYEYLGNQILLMNKCHAACERYFGNPAQFRKQFRVSKSTFQILVEMFKSSEYFPKNPFGKCAKTAETHIAAFAGDKCVLRTVAQIFNTMFVNIERVMSFLMSVGPKIIKFPNTTDKKESLSAEFLKIAGFPGVLGCIDGSYIPIRTPERKVKSTYINRHEQTSLTL